MKQPPHFFYMDVPTNATCTKIEYVMLNEKGNPIPPYKSIAVSEKFEDVFEKELLFKKPDPEEESELI
ncbi:hypothetical protein [Telluribacter humicola]|uniref:hypothetical protein n=1 Tax=Telluribacter humicola TaxID=1720261 RepID=UPI001A962722|nr:hypothetical protein [Telluribacter humicola]